MFYRVLLSGILLSIALFGKAQLKRFSFSQPKMGSVFTIILYDTDTLHAAVTAKQCFQLIDKYVQVYSDYIDSSELNRLCAAAGKAKPPFHVSSDLLDILLLSKKAFELSEGSFDITLGPLTHLWRKSRKEAIFPDNKTIKEKSALTGFNKIIIDSTAGTVSLLQEGMQLDLGGIAQGYIAQKIIDYLKANNIADALVDVSGDIAAIGAPPGVAGWTVGINLPERKEELLSKKLLITGKAVTTSGDVYQYMEHNGKRYSHIINPKTGYGITSRRNVTVIADDAVTADWLTKAGSILPVRKAKKLAGELNAEVLIAEIKKKKLVFYRTKGFAAYWKNDNKL